MNENHRLERIGHAAEDAVLAALLARGMHLEARNYLVPRYGEIDLIMTYKNCLYIIEVKSRLHHDRYGGACEAITPQKRLRIHRATAFFLANHRWDEFDVVFMAGLVTHEQNERIIRIEIVPI